MHACEPATLARVEALHEEIGQRAETVSRAIIQRVHDAIERRKLAERLVPLLRKQVWIALPSRIGGPLALPVLVHARITALASAFQLWRLTTAGFSLWRLGLLATTLFAALRGSLEVRGLLARIDEELAAPLADMTADVNRFLADRHLHAPAAAAPNEGSPDRELQQAVAAVPGAGAALARVFERLASVGETGRVTRELAPLVTEAIDRRAEEAASRCAGFFVQLFNVLPLAAIVHVAYEIVSTWVQRQWLPGNFYLHATAIFLLTLLPGYLLVCLNVGRQMRRTETLASILAAAEKLPPCGPAQALAALAGDLAAIVAGLRALRARAASVRGAIDVEFGVSEIGARVQAAKEESAQSAQSKNPSS